MPLGFSTATLGYFTFEHLCWISRNGLKFRFFFPAVFALRSFCFSVCVGTRTLLLHSCRRQCVTALCHLPHSDADIAQFGSVEHSFSTCCYAVLAWHMPLRTWMDAYGTKKPMMGADASAAQPIFSQPDNASTEQSRDTVRMCCKGGQGCGWHFGFRFEVCPSTSKSRSRRTDCERMALVLRTMPRASRTSSLTSTNGQRSSGYHRATLWR